MASKRNSTSAAAGVGPGLELLEPRLMLDGDVTAAVANGDLVITGDVAANGILIEQGAAPGVVILSSTVTSPTTINGAAGPITLSGFTRNLRLSMGDGDDVVQIHDLVTPAKATLDLGEGNNVLEILATTVKGDLKITAGTGNDTVSLGDPLNLTPTIFQGNTSVQTGAGDDQVTADTITGFAKKLFSLDLGDGDDQADIESARLPGTLSVNGGSGDDQLTLRQTAVGGVATVLGGLGNDTLVLDGGTFALKTVVDGGAGNDTFTVSACDFAADVSFLGGTGDDAIGLDTVGADKKLLVDTGQDDDTLTLGGSQVKGTTAITASGTSLNATITGSTFLQTAKIDPPHSNQVMIEARITLVNSTFLQDLGVDLTKGQGSNVTLDSTSARGVQVAAGQTGTATFLQSTLHKNGLKFTGGSGDDTLSLDGLTAEGAVAIDLRAGTNSLHVLGGSLLSGSFSVDAIGLNSILDLQDARFVRVPRLLTRSGNNSVIVTGTTLDGGLNITPHLPADAFYSVVIADPSIGGPTLIDLPCRSSIDIQSGQFANLFQVRMGRPTGDLTVTDSAFGNFHATWRPGTGSVTATKVTALPGGTIEFRGRVATAQTDIQSGIPVLSGIPTINQLLATLTAERDGHDMQVLITPRAITQK